MTEPSTKVVVVYELSGYADTLNSVPNTSISVSAVSIINGFFSFFDILKYPSPIKVTHRVFPSNMEGYSRVDSELSHTILLSDKITLYSPPLGTTSLFNIGELFSVS